MHIHRYRLLNATFDTSAHFLETPNADWEEETRALHDENRRRGVEMLRYQHGSERLDAVVRNAIDLGPDPFSVLAWHNSLWLDIKLAFRSCCYYSAAVAAGTLGERMLNHMVLDLGGDFGATPSKPLTFQNALRTLNQWGVLEPGVADLFDELRKQRNALVHFDVGLYAQLRTRSLSVVGLLRAIIDAQFGILVQRRLIADTPGVMFVRRDVENEPFVRRYVLPTGMRVGPRHSLAFDESTRFWRVESDDPIDANEDTDDEFVRLWRGGSA